MSLIRRSGVLTLAVCVAGCLASCQAVFTFSPLSFLQRDPAALSEAQQLEYAQTALESGDAEAIQAAYDAIREAALSSDDPLLQYTAAQLALELSGVGDVFTGLLGSLGEGDAAGGLELSADVFAALDMDLLAEAAGLLEGAEADGASLTATDYFVGAVGLVVAGAGSEDILADIENNPNLDRAEDFLSEGVNLLEEDDPARGILEEFLGLLGGEGA